jgi:hypothetical protein
MASLAQAFDVPSKLDSDDWMRISTGGSPRRGITLAKPENDHALKARRGIPRDQRINRTERPADYEDRDGRGGSDGESYLP